MPPYTIEVRKENQGYHWSNTWHVEADNLTNARDAAHYLATFEEALLASDCTIFETKTSAWPNPSNQDFVIDQENLIGDRDLGALQPATMCLLVKILTATGHPGKKWLRCSLDESEVQQVAGKAVLTNTTALTTAFTAAVAALVDSLANDGTTLLVGSAPGTAREASGAMAIAGVGYRDMDVGWYNRTT